MDFDVISPKTNSELLEAISSCKNKKIKFGAGYTDLINELHVKPIDDLTVINLDKLKDDNFRIITKTEKGIRIGALATATMMLESEVIKNDFPVLWEATNSVASRQIRETATVGGNICQASPSGDMSCALVSLNAVCEIINSTGKVREEKLADFFQGVKKTSLEDDEILRSIFVPLNTGKKIKSGYIKIGTRMSMEISIAALAYHFQLDEKSLIQHAGIAIGAMAPVIKYTEEACKFLIGKNVETISCDELIELAELVKKYASPISDLRASAWYRSEVLFNSTIAIFEKNECKCK